MSALANLLQTLHTWMGKAFLGAGQTLVNAPSSEPTYEEWQRRKTDVIETGKRNGVIKSLWHDECSQCARYLLKSDEEMEQELIKLCLENYSMAFHAFTDCFDNTETAKSKSWKEKYPGIMSSDKIQAIKTIQHHWQKMFPSINSSQVAEEFQVISTADSHLNRIGATRQYEPSLLEDYRRAIEAMAKIASTLQKPMLSEFILLHYNERQFNVEANEPYTAACWGKPAYSFIGGPLTDNQLKWMIFAFNIAHAPDKEHDQIGYEGDDEAAKLLELAAGCDTVH